ncbi:RNA pyrophosphohydrolase [Candidatus Rariloculus sp.]|uniref:RNA pyrophosphohydrolase n=1 Tax=Candidatus Rariloculus sp. TaxID=3101265 RepID=UPI003D0FFAEE
MDFIDEHGFRANVGMIITDGHGHVLIAGRRGQSGWQFPQGGVGPEETIESAMYRELREEVGLNPNDVNVVGSTRDWLRYRLPERYIRRGRSPVCIGQKQRWFLLQLVCDPAALRFDLSERPEFDRCRWVDYWQPVKEVIYFKRRVYERALTELGPLAFPDSGPPPPNLRQQP